MLFCKKCGKTLTGKQTSYCSLKCSKLHLKSLYKKRKKDQVNAYNREWKKRGIRGHPSDNKYIAEFKEKHQFCVRCGSSENIHICHIKPRDKSGSHKDNLIALCPKDHYIFDALLKPYWEDITYSKH